MPFLKVSITRFVDSHFPGFVECQFLDVHGVTKKFEEKIPVVTTEDLWIDSEYPRPGVVECAVVRRRLDESRRMRVTIDLNEPLWLEPLDRENIVEVFAAQLDDQEEGSRVEKV
jgi:hypothetical protein